VVGRIDCGGKIAIAEIEESRNMGGDVTEEFHKELEGE
jgi:hypothetical protein